MPYLQVDNAVMTLSGGMEIKVSQGDNVKYIEVIRYTSGSCFDICKTYEITASAYLRDDTFKVIHEFSV